VRGVEGKWDNHAILVTMPKKHIDHIKAQQRGKTRSKIAMKCELFYANRFIGVQNPACVPGQTDQKKIEKREWTEKVSKDRRREPFRPVQRVPISVFPLMGGKNRRGVGE